jgi:hypothetical protein
MSMLPHLLSLAVNPLFGLSPEPHLGFGLSFCHHVIMVGKTNPGLRRASESAVCHGKLVPHIFKESPFLLFIVIPYRMH